METEADVSKISCGSQLEGDCDGWGKRSLHPLRELSPSSHTHTKILRFCLKNHNDFGSMNASMNSMTHVLAVATNGCCVCGDGR